jgi:hypothetical protein
MKASKYGMYFHFPRMPLPTSRGDATEVVGDSCCAHAQQAGTVAIRAQSAVRHRIMDGSPKAAAARDPEPAADA